MKQISNFKRTIGYLDKLERALNDEYFGGTLPPVIVTVRDLRGKTGCFVQDAVWHREEGGNLMELALCPSALSEPIEEIAAILLHQMVHAYCFVQGIKECSRNGEYHNSKFAEQAFRRGLLVDYDQTIGFGRTMPSDGLIGFCTEHEFPEIVIWRECPQEEKGGKVECWGTSKKAKTASRSIRYVCPGCGSIARATKPVYLICGSCKRDMLCD